MRTVVVGERVGIEQFAGVVGVISGRLEPDGQVVVVVAL